MNRIQARFVKDGLAEQNNLNEWERNFLNNLATKFEDKDLTPDQNRKLNQIQKKISSLSPSKVFSGYGKSEDKTDEELSFT